MGENNSSTPRLSPLGNKSPISPAVNIKPSHLKMMNLKSIKEAKENLLSDEEKSWIGENQSSLSDVSSDQHFGLDL